MTPEQIHIIIQDEIGAEFPNDKRYYNAKCLRPSYPSGESGVTIGIGYDLGYNNKDTIKRDWAAYVNPNALVYFIECAGIKGSFAKKKIDARSGQIIIPYDIAMKVFLESSLPKFTKATRSIYPNLDNLNETTQAVLIGLVYNRGAALQGDRRLEMKQLVEATNNADYNEIARLIDSMKRLWTNGLVARRENESKLILQSV